MVVRKTRKVVKYRGSKTHGCGSMKKRRGAGHRGGRGRAGSGKRGDGKKPSYWKEKVGKFGFTSIHASDKTMNISHLDSCVENLVAQGKAVEKAGVFVVDLKKLSVDKLLGAGKVTKKFDISVAVASPKAIEKVEKAGGKIKTSTPTKTSDSADAE